VAALRRLTPQRDGTIAFGPIVRLAESGRATYPVMAGALTGLVAAWTSGAPEAAVISVRQIPNH
jgi:hypothetical protein